VFGEVELGLRRNLYGGWVAVAYLIELGEQRALLAQFHRIEVGWGRQRR
jgi:hypothetical protein